MRKRTERKKRKKRKGNEREESAHWCWHLRERWCFNALVEEIVSSRILGLHSHIYTLKHTHIHTLCLAVSGGEQSASPCVYTHSPVVYSSPHASMGCVYACVCMCASPSVSINSPKSTYLCMLKIFLTDDFAIDFITLHHTHQLLLRKTIYNMRFPPLLEQRLHVIKNCKCISPKQTTNSMYSTCN